MGSAMAIGENRAKEAIIAALDSPLLNDNKITGAKNVLLLIVSGTSEITIDEIGEINDHIQAEAGFNANIIMGVGEDETLGESIAVTIIATGFNMYGDPVTVEGTELLARCVQHETDHLDGILFIDRLDKKQRKLAMKAIREAEWSGMPAPQVKVSPHSTQRIS